MRSVVIDALSGKQIVAGAEERDATQPFVFYLTQRLGWHPKQIITRPQWRVPKSPSSSRSAGYPVDIAIFDSVQHCGDPSHIRIIVECKAPDQETGIRELKTYLGLEPETRLGVWFNGDRHLLVWKVRDGFTIDEYGRVPLPTDPLAPAEAKPPLRYGDLVPPPNLGTVFRRLRDRIAAQDTQVNRDEFILNDLANLLVCKIADEQDGEVEPQRPMAFQQAGSRAATADAVGRFFEAIKGRLTSVFVDPEERLHIDDASLARVVRTLQPYRLLDHDRQAVGKAFQVLRGRALKGEEGAYFTPPALVDCVVSILNPNHSTSVIDPACGTGGFLAAALDHVFSQVDISTTLGASARQNARSRWAAHKLFAVDKDAVSTKLCRAYLSLLGDGRAHVYRADTIDRSDWHLRGDELSRVVQSGAFAQVMTNPPFGKNLKVTAEVGRAEGLQVCQGWACNGDGWRPTGKWKKQQLGLAFFERNLDLLRDGGHMAIVLPETFLFSATFKWFVDWICRTTTVTHVVDVPMVAFEEFCRAKTCLLFVQKSRPPDGHQTIMSFPKSIGQDKRGKPVYQVNEVGERRPGGRLDNDMAEAVERIVSTSYHGHPKGRSRVEESSLCFAVSQSHVRERGILVPRFWWRREADDALRAWTEKHPSDIVTLGELEEEGTLLAFGGHGSPPVNVRGIGSIPYVKVTDLKNWRINENPTNYIRSTVAETYRRSGPDLTFGDLVSPARASSNIGQFSMVLPWQTQLVITKEVLILRVEGNDRQLDPFLLLAVMSLKVVQDQYRHLVLMQTNREHLGDHWREVRIPLPETAARRAEISDHMRTYFETIIGGRASYDAIVSVYDPDDFGTRP